ncbi:nuclear transport factor 2 family protein [Streptomyces rugosispiralis]|uniref:Nuclear transport factor 2 family protein n=1 Tax=Streptomyces rugosispiralis TaxID=2967341 RepID=A0ABT1UQB3_9ACTN|nr:nuclear transport factor 2 family protein [Streptomyces rugosispiralis]MCQ8186765.1 nuclear transport factor 2 family protein [Streptomyces rugosispiralis]
MSDSPRAVFEKLLAGMVNRDFDSLRQLYAQDIVLEHPFAVPERTVTRGQEGLRRLLDGLREWFEATAKNVVIHETADAEVIVAEWDYEMRVPGTDQLLTTANVIVLRVRDGRIVESRDYHNHAALAQIVTG